MVGSFKKNRRWCRTESRFFLDRPHALQFGNYAFKTYPIHVWIPGTPPRGWGRRWRRGWGRTPRRWSGGGRGSKPPTPPPWQSWWASWSRRLQGYGVLSSLCVFLVPSIFPNDFLLDQKSNSSPCWHFKVLGSSTRSWYTTCKKFQKKLFIYKI